jgi:Cys-tRNA(Pro) deacylase
MDVPASASASTRTKLEELIEAGEIIARMIAPGVPTPTVPDAAAALGVEAGQIVKSLLFVTKTDDAVLAIACGDSRVDRKRLALALGATDVKMATPEVVLSVTGYAAGGTPPVGHITNVPVVVDARVMRWPVVYGGGGQVDALLEITPQEICRVTGARVVDIVV